MLIVSWTRIGMLLPVGGGQLEPGLLGLYKPGQEFENKSDGKDLGLVMLIYALLKREGFPAIRFKFEPEH